MLCARCAGLSVLEVIVEGGARIFALRCLHCGDVTDHVILINRRRCQHGQLGQPRASVYDKHRSTRKRPTLRMNTEEITQY